MLTSLALPAEFSFILFPTKELAPRLSFFFSIFIEIHRIRTKKDSNNQQNKRKLLQAAPLPLPPKNKDHTSYIMQGKKK